MLSTLRNRRDEILLAEPKLRSRDLALKLGISELELLTLDLGTSAADQPIRLAGDFKALLAEIHRLGYVMALTRNAHVVHERKGVYNNVEFYEGAHNMGVVVNPDIDLRLFMNEWVYGLAVIMKRERAEDLHGLLFFDQYGEAVHKIYSTSKSDLSCWDELLNKYRTDQQPVILDKRERPAAPAEKPDAEIDIDAFRQEWSNLKDTHHFFGMLRKYGVSRTQGLRLAPEGMVTPVSVGTVGRMLESAAAEQVPIMCFVHSSGCIQIHTGPVKNIRWMGSWLNVMDPEFNLHLATEAIAEAFVVRKPTEDGLVRSLELFDAKGEMITYFFGARKPGKPELPEWSQLAESLAEQELLTV